MRCSKCGVLITQGQKYNCDFDGNYVHWSCKNAASTTQCTVVDFSNGGLISGNGDLPRVGEFTSPFPVEVFMLKREPES